jgi:hypothetical protein
LRRDRRTGFAVRMTNPCGMHLRTEVPAHGGPETLSAAEGASNSSVAMHKYTVYKALAGSRRVVSDVADPRITARGPAVLRPIYIGAERAW